ncbi:hypothetical protein OsJ_32605 [Oryza sativa Japonica Group]|uniref:Protein FAR1-RELATED SEQUENCE n=2 Tax=Oryza sativa subsp. japonica TaxID=39947 RepID=A0A9K3Y7M3_ORYSJ|nr:hypothetical protein [Oryza sativa Japonica Group]AAP55185.1 hypothetical protein LOC_Os10g42920 [Oryza sativa Japonica Group]EAZ17107.1 hypothetical protein OsJ_32605 [Oryza sativa Japonica Group]KAF2915015.1 hypothetical protein DAI22_10g207500 [Oryza sativa Japonica Group]
MAPLEGMTGVYCARMASTQRSESANFMLKSIMPRNSTLNRFIEQFAKLQFDRESDDANAEKANKQKRLWLKPTFPVDGELGESTQYVVTGHVDGVGALRVRPCLVHP